MRHPVYDLLIINMYFEIIIHVLPPIPEAFPPLENGQKGQC